MRMKALLKIAALLVTALAVNAAAPPAPDASLGWPTNQTVLTNVSVVLPIGTFQNAKVYAPDVAKQKGVQIAWNVVDVPDLASYTVKWGDVLSADAPTSLVVNKATNIIFYSLDPATTYYFYVVAVNTAAEESPPSSVIIFQPGS